jgi:molybdate transport system substrate-binding protein
MLVSLVIGHEMPAMALAQELPKAPVLTLAAASTTNAIDEIRQQFTKDTGIEVRTSYAASSTLAKQITNGADADVFVSADQKWADFLGDKGLIAQRRNLLGNRLVIIVPKDSSLQVTKPEDLTAAGVQHLALGDPESVPAGRYAKQALTKLGIWEQLKGKVVAAEDVRHALTFVETGNAQAGIVYSTDAAISKAVNVVAEVPAELTEPIHYPVALLTHGKGRPGAESFYRYLMSPAAAKVFQKYGFSVLEQTETASPR